MYQCPFYLNSHPVERQNACQNVLVSILFKFLSCRETKCLKQFTVIHFIQILILQLDETLTKRYWCPFYSISYPVERKKRSPNFRFPLASFHIFPMHAGYVKPPFVFNRRHRHFLDCLLRFSVIFNIFWIRPSLAVTVCQIKQ